ncbi:SusD/RagB family nutrient-binding outer membrane lipoprotein [Flavitalea sp. BT771]|uniref:SusD/RagB family nutrient-binding outer membrane lipoprotein n=1 Tax=Flavitalea sp. BT771 TaxID=3063329 RepID=UPI0026E3167E|nr:SusD/RagB family nutrient-binding outer membrane lipoprotein [Flavitalea sp. BT771]MDO6435403.1 SusD/RagB family nutrient-binding outer membrane lipoprotein [Flavitalea sp. BT771]MDV6224237.1 SusD/RagB family nutrient-binding outer membrane lipoprotein [Flavitalea sp. BT771]
MKNNFLLIFIIAFAALQYGCTKDFKNLNTDPYALTNEQLLPNNANVSAYFTTAQQNLVENGPWLTQLDNFYGDNFVGYVYPPSGFRGNQYPCTLFNQDGWQDGLWGNAYDNVLKQTYFIIKGAREITPATDATNTQFAIAKIIQVAGMHLVADGWGPIIYSKYAIPEADLVSYDYDSQQDVYKEFFADLDTAVTGLSALVAAGGTSTFGNLDMIYSGDLTKWIKAANSIRLRLGLRLTRIDNATAKVQVQKALSEPHGIITDNADNMHVNFNSALGGGFVQVSRDWTDERLGADFETILTGYNDPRLPLFFSPATDPTVGAIFKGIREGADIAAKGDYVGYSAVNVGVFGQNPAGWGGDLNVITAAEVNEALAEVALRGWGTGAYTGTAQSYYEAGIKAHFDMYGISTAAYNTYIAGTSLPVNYVDPKKSAHNIAAVNLVPVKYDPTASLEHQLQQILTQKWIALFPNGKEAWSEWRRTGYPKVFPNYLNYSGGTISTTDGARRIFKFALGEYQTNANGIKTALTALGGPDVGGTHVWWDPASNTSNF